VRNPTFPDAELTEMKKQYAASLEQMRSDTQDASDRAFKQALYAKDSVYYAASIDELEEQLNALTGKDLSDFHNQYYSPNGMILTIVGDVDVDETLALVQAQFGNWQGAAPQPIVVASTAMPAAAHMVQVAIADKSNVDILVGHPVELRRNAADYLAAKLANSALGGDTLTSRLGVTVRVKDGYTYGVYSSFEDVAQGGAPWEIGLSVNPSNVDNAVKAVNEVWNDFVKNGITDQELSDGAGTAAGSFIVRLRTADGIAGVLTGFEQNGLGISAIDTYANDLKAVTKGQVDAAIKKYFHPQAAVTVEAGTLKK
jgi:zinc protease